MSRDEGWAAPRRITAANIAVSPSEPIHPPGTLEQYLPKEKHLGVVDMTGVEVVIKEETEEEKQRKIRVENKPDISLCLSLYDFEVSSTVGSSDRLLNHAPRRPSPSPSCLPLLGPTVSSALASYRAGADHKLFTPTDSSGADDEITMRENRSAYQRIWFRPRVLRDVTNVDYSSTILGLPVSTGQRRDG